MSPKERKSQDLPLTPETITILKKDLSALIAKVGLEKLAAQANITPAELQKALTVLNHLSLVTFSSLESLLDQEGEGMTIDELLPDPDVDVAGEAIGNVRREELRKVVQKTLTPQETPTKQRRLGRKKREKRK